MVQSMTGYGKSELRLEGGKLTIEIRSVNGKNADINLKTALLPREKETVVRQLLAQRLQRGTIDMFITWESDGASGAKSINWDIAAEYYRQIAAFADRVNAPCSDLNGIIGYVLNLPEVIDRDRHGDIINDDNWEIVYSSIEKAVDAIEEFRKTEGEALKKDVSAKVETILALSHEVEKFEAERIRMQKEKILNRFNELELEVDKSRLEQEMIYYIEKLDINEERIRLRQHCAYFIETLENDPMPGRKLGFIAQEMGREINTTGSKSNNSDMQKLVVKMKDELEKIKEQSLNIL